MRAPARCWYPGVPPPRPHETDYRDEYLHDVGDGIVVLASDPERAIEQDWRSATVALTLAEEFRPEVVILDIGMPQMDGYETACRLRALPWSESMLLIALTGWERRARPGEG